MLFLSDEFICHVVHKCDDGAQRVHVYVALSGKMSPVTRIFRYLEILTYFESTF